MASVNKEFLETLFHGIREGCAATLHSFPGDPSERASWVAMPWRPGKPLPTMSPMNNNYCCVSSFVRGVDGKYFRRKMMFDSLHCVMIDDLGTKLPMSDLRIEPTALIETSPGNFQAWLVLDQPIRAISAAEALIDSMIEQGITAQMDPGMKGVTRVARLPGGANGKRKLGKPWAHRVHKLSGPFTSLPALVSAYALTLRPRAESDEIAPPRLGIEPERSGILEWLQVLGHYQAQMREGYHAMTCPWWESHSDRGKTGTYFMEPCGGNSWQGGFICNHGHCSERDITDLIGWLRAMKGMIADGTGSGGGSAPAFTERDGEQC